jgi:subtilisin family serine protease
MIRFLLIALILLNTSEAATIAIIDTGFDLDHTYLRPKILKKETDEEAIDFYGWDFFDNSHLKKPVIEDKTSLQEVLHFRNLRAKGHRQGLTLDEFDWYKKKYADKAFMEKVRLFKKHSHGTFVAGIALREGENINIFPIRGLNIPNTVVSVEDNSPHDQAPLKGRTGQEKFYEEIKQSIDRISRKFSKICHFIAGKNIDVVNASYGITFKNIMTKFRERHKEMTGEEIDEMTLKVLVDDYFRILYERGEKTMKRYPHVLFVFSAGNSGLNNDDFHHYPSRIKLPNAISVAAMNGDYLASFSNYGVASVDIGAPGVAILSLLPKVYSDDGGEIYSPASGTSMAAPYVSNLAAQIKNNNPKLTPANIKRIILETGNQKEHLKSKLISGAVVNNQKALKVALLSKDMPLDEAITLGKSDIIPIEDKIQLGMAPAISADDVTKKVMNAIPGPVLPLEITSEESSVLMDPMKEQPDKLVPPPSASQDELDQSSDLVPSSQNEEQSPKPSEDLPASSSQPQPSPQTNQSPENSPSSP